MIKETSKKHPKDTEVKVLAFPVCVDAFSWRVKGGRNDESEELIREPKEGVPLVKDYGTHFRVAIPCIKDGEIDVELLRAGLDAIELIEVVHVWRPWRTNEKARRIEAACTLSNKRVHIHRVASQWDERHSYAIR